MTSIHSYSGRQGLHHPQRWALWAWLGLAALLALLAGCGGGGGGTTVQPAAITTQPADAAVAAGSNASFTVAATGDGLAYQWQASTDNGSTWADISGATSANYALASVSAGANGSRYRAVITGSANSVTSTSATLTVTTPTAAPAITTEPATATVAVGSNASFTVAASGSAIAYAWQSSADGLTWAAVPGANAATLALSNVQLSSDATQYRAVLSNAGGSVTSSPATLNVLAALVAPSITVQPQASSVFDGASGTLSVAATGTAPISYRWQKNGVDVAGATSASYSTPALALADNGALYSVFVSNPAGTVQSSQVQIGVNPVPPAIATGPQAQSVIAGQTATFSVAATGSAPLSYQWRKNGAAIAGATASAYTTGTTTVADDGALYSVVVSNTASTTATSGTARLGVTAATVAPSIATAPASLSVTEGQAASFNVVAAGTAPLSYQWRRNGTDIAGATSASYSVASTAAADNTARFTVRVSNAAGTITSAEAVLTVQTASSVLIGKAWAAGQKLESDDNEVLTHRVVMDDAGHATVVFLKWNGTRFALYATRGTPNAAGSAPTWSTPQLIDTQGSTVLNNMSRTSNHLELGVSPAGNVVAVWFNSEPCQANGYRTTGTCYYYYMARWVAAAGAWDAPAQVGSFPAEPSAPLINDRGDVAVATRSWVRTTTFPYYSERRGATVRANGAASFTMHALDAAVTSITLGMDAAGNLLAAGEASQSGTTDLVAYRGTVAGSFGSQQVLDTRGATANFMHMAVGTAGQQAVLWTQNNGVSTTTHAATATAANAAFAVQDLGVSSVSSYGHLGINDAGQATMLDLGNRRRLVWSAGTWRAPETLPTGTPSSVHACAAARSGDMLCRTNSGQWLSYDNSRNVLVQAFSTAASGYVLGLSTSTPLYGAPVLSANGNGLVTMANGFDVLPSPAAPSGDSRSVKNLWAAYLK